MPHRVGSLYNLQTPYLTEFDGRIGAHRGADRAPTRRVPRAVNGGLINHETVVLK